MENTPADYEPEYFGPIANSILQGLKFPLNISVGQLITPDLDLKLKFVGLESLLHEDLSKLEMQSLPKADTSVFSATNHRNSNDTSLRTTQLCEELVQPNDVIDKLEKQQSVELVDGIERLEMDESDSITMKDRVRSFM